MLLPSVLRLVASVSLLGLAVSACGDGGAGGVGEDLGSTASAINPISGCDYSFARPSPSSLTAMGYQFAARYLSGDPGSGKDITAAEATSLTGAGLDVVLVWETSGTDATSGYSQGVSDATAAASEATAVGAPSTRPIYFAIDFEATSSDSTSINAYFQGVASVLGLSRTGVYGGYYIVDELFNAGLVTFGWQTYAWSSGAWDSRAQLRQTQNGVDDDELDADEGMVADFGQWGPGAPNSAPYAAQFVSQSFPLASTALAMTEGQTIPSYIELKNVGTKTWDSNTRIGTTQPRDRTSVFADTTWIGPNRPAGVTGTVPPGGTFKFQFDLHAPNMTGTFKEYFGVVEEGVAWFSDPGQGGPADDDLEVQVVVKPAPAGTTHDAGEPDAAVDSGAVGVDSGATVDAEAWTDAGIILDAGIGPGEGDDAGHRPTGPRDAGHAPETDEDAGMELTKAAAAGGCRVAKGESPPFASFALLGLAMLARAARARRTRRA